MRRIDVSVGETMEERAFAEIQPEQPAPPLPQRGRSTPWWRKTSWQVVASVAVVGIGVGAWFASRPAAQVHVHGTLALAAPGFLSSYNGCEGAGGYDDITAGVAVTVGGANGQVLGVGALSSGQPGVACTFSFDVAVPAGQSLYTVTISHRGTETFTPDKIGDIQLTLGS